MKHIAIVEDEAAIRENYADVIRRQGYQVHTYQDRPSAQTAFEQRLPDLAIIDIGLGNEIDGGFALCQALRALSATVPIIFLTARDSDIDTVVGLRMGADDYLTKDVSLPHLMARIAALFRRSDLLAQTPSTEDKCLQSGPLYLDLDRMRVYWLDQLIDLTVTEFWMVHALVKRPGHVKSRQALMDEAHAVVDDSTITSHIKRIRKKFMVIDSQFDCIRTVYGMGYRWDEAQA
ncbi:proteobacterial dedicated sortase system response regulator [Salinivibrio sp. EAGSL]|jgi:two component transcriptional regulator, winged helix family|uniref:proteobacterial dedicated sortase system response regulator n=1 Tax=Salinivibrio sp. EAGSL TaxID=2738468 RepID=UPI00158849E4|nr:proteobacterial dedicated sortase system response regulator [Salinivibrio sp. EAGSL]NUY55854.1 proteobacterial dedicated sortase system response regulator [Salinivibrio sp. EAGSL]